MPKTRIMKTQEDAFGQELWAYYKGNDVLEIVERDDGFIEACTSPKTYFSEFENWSPAEKKGMDFVKGKVLDIGCGAGRHSLYLQQKGFDVLGIDKSPLAIEVCKMRGLKKARVMAIEDVDFKPDSFGTITMMGNNFGLFGNLKKARQLLMRFAKITTKDALIIAETRDPYRTDNPVHLEYHKFNKSRGRMSGQLRLRVRFRKYATRWFDYLIVSKKETQEILRGTRWKVKEFLDSDDAAYIAILEKSAQ